MALSTDDLRKNANQSGIAGMTPEQLAAHNERRQAELDAKQKAESANAKQGIHNIKSNKTNATTQSELQGSNKTVPKKKATLVRTPQHEPKEEVDYDAVRKRANEKAIELGYSDDVLHDDGNKEKKEKGWLSKINEANNNKIISKAEKRRVSPQRVASYAFDEKTPSTIFNAFARGFNDATTRAIQKAYPDATIADISTPGRNVYNTKNPQANNVERIKNPKSALQKMNADLSNEIPDKKELDTFLKNEANEKKKQHNQTNQGKG